MNFNFLKNVIRQYFSFSKQERNGLYFLSILLLILVVSNFLIERIVFVKSDTDHNKLIEAIRNWELSKQELINEERLFAFDPNTISAESLDTLKLPWSVKQNLLRYRQSGGIIETPEEIKKIYGMNDSIYLSVRDYIRIKRDVKKIDDIEIEIEEFLPEYSLFDPNNSTEEEMKNLGFDNFQIQNLISYRNSGGNFKEPEDLLKIYGIDSQFYNTIFQWINIDSFYFSLSENKIAIELNTADSVDLLKLNGIGPVFASRIIKYRNLLGGFYKKEQLLEVYNLSEEVYNKIIPEIFIDTTMIKKISLNFSDFGEISAHPYISNDLARLIIESRSKNGSFKSLKNINEENIITIEKFQEIESYLKLN